VHPESYPLVEKILADLKRDVKSVIGDSGLLKSLNPAKYADERFGLPTVTDILKELDKPGRDPRPEFTTATFKDGVEEIGDLRPDMVLEVDAKRKRIALTMRLSDSAPAAGGKPERADRNDAKRLAQHQRQDKPAPGNAMAAAFARLKP
jgi:uncharacterized protein